MHDLVIRNGTVVDGSGAARRYADVATFGASRHVGQALLQWMQSASLEGARS